MMEQGLQRWFSVVRAANAERMRADRHQWELHAGTHRSLDLQAWYHSEFSDELYRLRGVRLLLLG